MADLTSRTPISLEITDRRVEDAVWRFRDLGLGRGLDVTNPDMWTNKTSGGMREISPDLSNVNTTAEGGTREYYQEVNSSLAACQDEILLSMSDPTMQKVRIGSHNHLSDNTFTNKITVGERISTRTISFSDNYPETETPTFSDSVFEMRLCRLIYKRLHPRSEDQDPTFQNAPISALSKYIQKLQHEKNVAILQDIASTCNDYVCNTGITHYISSIELGALRYNTYTLGEYQRKVGSGVGVMGGPLAPVTITGPKATRKMEQLTYRTAIGKMSKGTVRKDTTDETVISFQILPIYQLVKLQHVRVALTKAVKDYIQRNRAPDTAKCYTVGTVSSSSKVIYWTVNQHNQLMGTESKEQASLFHVLPAENKRNPSEFFIRYDKHITGAGSRYYYFKYEANITGCTPGPLTLSPEIGERFTVQSKTPKPNLCASMTHPLHDWTEGQELYLNCHRHSIFKMNGYVALRSRPTSVNSSSAENGSDQPENKKIYEMIGVSLFQKEDDKSKSTQFRLMVQDQSATPKRDEESRDEEEEVFDLLFGSGQTYRQRSGAMNSGRKERQADQLSNKRHNREREGAHHLSLDRERTYTADGFRERLVGLQHQNNKSITSRSSSTTVTASREEFRKVSVVRKQQQN